MENDIQFAHDDIDNALNGIIAIKSNCESLASALQSVDASILDNNLLPKDIQIVNDAIDFSISDVLGRIVKIETLIYQLEDANFFEELEAIISSEKLGDQELLQEMLRYVMSNSDAHFRDLLLIEDFRERFILNQLLSSYGFESMEQLDSVCNALLEEIKYYNAQKDVILYNPANITLRLMDKWNIEYNGTPFLYTFDTIDNEVVVYRYTNSEGILLHADSLDQIPDTYRATAIPVTYKELCEGTEEYNKFKDSLEYIINGEDSNGTATPEYKNFHNELRTRFEADVAKLAEIDAYLNGGAESDVETNDFVAAHGLRGLLSSYQYIGANIRIQSEHLSNIYGYMLNDDFVIEANKPWNYGMPAFDEIYSLTCAERESQYIFEPEQVMSILYAIISGNEDISLCGRNVSVITEFDEYYSVEAPDDPLVSNYALWSSIMTEDEKNCFYYILNTKGVTDAHQYLEDMSGVLDSRWISEQSSKDKEFAKEHPVKASAASIITNPFEGLMALSYVLERKLVGDDSIARSQIYSHADTYRAGVLETLGPNGQFWYSTVMSMADNLFSMAITGGNPTLSGLTLALGSYDDSLNDALDRGLTLDQAFAFANTSAAIEWFTESVSVEALLNMKPLAGKVLSVDFDTATDLTGGKGFLQKAFSLANGYETWADSGFGQVLDCLNGISNPVERELAYKALNIAYGSFKQGLGEGKEEVLSSILGHYADKFISGENSAYLKEIESYINLGYTEAEAFAMANKSFAEEIKTSFLAGFASGGMLGSGSLTINYVKNDVVINDILSQSNIGDYNMSSAGVDLRIGNYDTFFYEMVVNPDNATALSLEQRVSDAQTIITQLKDAGVIDIKGQAALNQYVQSLENAVYVNEGNYTRVISNILNATEGTQQERVLSSMVVVSQLKDQGKISAEDSAKMMDFIREYESATGDVEALIEGNASTRLAERMADNELEVLGESQTSLSGDEGALPQQAVGKQQDVETLGSDIVSADSNEVVPELATDYTAAVDQNRLNSLTSQQRQRMDDKQSELLEARLGLEESQAPVSGGESISTQEVVGEQNPDILAEGVTTGPSNLVAEAAADASAAVDQNRLNSLTPQQRQRMDDKQAELLEARLGLEESQAPVSGGESISTQEVVGEQNPDILAEGVTTGPSNLVAEAATDASAAVDQNRLNSLTPQQRQRMDDKQAELLEARLGLEESQAPVSRGEYLRANPVVTEQQDSGALSGKRTIVDFDAKATDTSSNVVRDNGYLQPDIDSKKGEVKSNTLTLDVSQNDMDMQTSDLVSNEPSTRSSSSTIAAASVGTEIVQTTSSDTGRTTQLNNFNQGMQSSDSSATNTESADSSLNMGVGLAMLGVNAGNVGLAVATSGMDSYSDSDSKGKLYSDEKIVIEDDSSRAYEQRTGETVSNEVLPSKLNSELEVDSKSDFVVDTQAINNQNAMIDSVDSDTEQSGEYELKEGESLASHIGAQFFAKPKTNSGSIKDEIDLNNKINAETSSTVTRNVIVDGKNYVVNFLTNIKSIVSAKLIESKILNDLRTRTNVDSIINSTPDSILKFVSPKVIIRAISEGRYKFSDNTPSIINSNPAAIVTYIKCIPFGFYYSNCSNIDYSNCSNEQLKEIADILESNYVPFTYNFESKSSQTKLFDYIVNNYEQYPRLVREVVDYCSPEILSEHISEVLTVLTVFTYDSYYRFDPNGKNNQIIANAVVSDASSYPGFVRKLVDYCSPEILSKNINKVLTVLNNDSYYSFNPNGKNSQIIADAVVSDISSYSNLVKGAVDYCSPEILSEHISEVLTVLNNDSNYSFNPNGKNALIIIDSILNSSNIQEYVVLVSKIYDNYFSVDLVQKNPKLCSELYFKLKYTNSSSLNSFGGSLAAQLMNAADPIGCFEKIEKIFIKNNLPLFGKQFLAFQTIYPNLGVFNFYDGGVISPQLQDSIISEIKFKGIYDKGLSLNDRRFLVIYNDLLRIAVKSNNPLFREYLVNIDQGNTLFLNISSGDLSFDSLNLEQRKTLDMFVSHLETLYFNTKDGKNSNIDFSSLSLQEKLTILSDKFKPTSRYDLKDRIVRSFAYTAGYKSFNDIIQDMDATIRDADARGRKLASEIQSNNGKYVVGNTDFIRGIGSDVAIFGSSLDIGNVSKEFLTMITDNSSSDATPLDVDFGYGSSHGYGSIELIIRDDNPNFYVSRTSGGVLTDVDYDPSKNEIFSIGIVDNTHWGVRTGIALTDVDLIQTSCSFEDLKKIKFEIARHGYYVPVINSDGKLVFTPQEFDYLRTKMSGLSHYGIDSYAFSSKLDIPNVSEIVSKFDENVRETSIKRQKIESLLQSVFSSEKFNLKMEHEITEDLTAGTVELVDTGSTGRGTNSIGGGDFDFILRVDRQLMINSTKYSEFKDAIQSLLRSYPHQKFVVTGSGDFQAKGVQIDADTTVDIDISFALRTEKIGYSSDMCLKDRLQTMKKTNPLAYRYSIANIIEAKRVLKEGHVYKNFRSDSSQGGLGGIGIENWVLQHGGSFVEAAESFVSSALGDDWRTSSNTEAKSFGDFKAGYSVWDFGQNHFTERNHPGNYLFDEFVDGNMSDSGYRRMVEVLRNYLLEYYDSGYTGRDILNLSINNNLLENASSLGDSQVNTEYVLGDGESLSSHVGTQFFANPKYNDDTQSPSDWKTTIDSEFESGYDGKKIDGGAGLDLATVETASLGTETAKSNLANDLDIDSEVEISSNLDQRGTLNRSPGSGDINNLAVVDVSSALNIDLNSESGSDATTRISSFADLLIEASDEDDATRINEILSGLDKNTLVETAKYLVDNNLADCDLIGAISYSTMNYLLDYFYENDVSYIKPLIELIPGNMTNILDYMINNNSNVNVDLIEKCLSVYDDLKLFDIVDRSSLLKARLNDFAGCEFVKRFNSFNSYRQNLKTTYRLVNNSVISLSNANMDTVMEIINSINNSISINEILANADLNVESTIVLLDKVLNDDSYYGILGDIIGAIQPQQMSGVVANLISNNYDLKVLNSYLTTEQFISVVDDIFKSSDYYNEIRAFLGQTSFEKILAAYNVMSYKQFCNLTDVLDVSLIELCMQKISDGSLETYVKSLSDSDFIDFINEVSKQVCLDINDIVEKIINYERSRFDRVIKTLKYDENFSDFIKNVLSQSVSRESYFERYAIEERDSNYSYFGIDQGIIKKYNGGGYIVTDISWMKSPDDFAEFIVRDYKSRNPKSSMTKEEAIAIVTKLSSGNCRVRSTNYELIIRYLSENYSIDEVRKIQHHSFDRCYTPQYQKVLNKLVSNGTDVVTATRILDCVDSTGVCSYASVANLIFDYYKDIPAQFKHDFGFDLYVEMDGQLRINEIELLADMYISINSNLLGGTLFNYDNGKYSIVSGSVNTEKQVYLSNSKAGVKTDIINAYLRLKNSSFSINKEFLSFDVNSSKSLTVEGLKKIFIDALQDGKSVDLGVYKTSKKITFLYADGRTCCSTMDWNEGNGHAVYVVGVNNDSVIVSSWGKKLYISLSDLVDNRFTISIVSNILNPTSAVDRLYQSFIESNIDISKLSDAQVHDIAVACSGSSGSPSVYSKFIYSIAESELSNGGEITGRTKELIRDSNSDTVVELFNVMSSSNNTLLFNEVIKLSGVLDKIDVSKLSDAQVHDIAVACSGSPSAYSKFIYSLAESELSNGGEITGRTKELIRDSNSDTVVELFNVMSSSNNTLLFNEVIKLSGVLDKIDMSKSNVEAAISKNGIFGISKNGIMEKILSTATDKSIERMIKSGKLNEYLNSLTASEIYDSPLAKFAYQIANKMDLNAKGDSFVLLTSDQVSQLADFMKSVDIDLDQNLALSQDTADMLDSMNSDTLIVVIDKLLSNKKYYGTAKEMIKFIDNSSLGPVFDKVRMRSDSKAITSCLNTDQVILLLNYYSDDLASFNRFCNNVSYVNFIKVAKVLSNLISEGDTDATILYKSLVANIDFKFVRSIKMQQKNGTLGSYLNSMSDANIGRLIAKMISQKVADAVTMTDTMINILGENRFINMVKNGTIRFDLRFSQETQSKILNIINLKDGNLQELSVYGVDQGEIKRHIRYVVKCNWSDDIDDIANYLYKTEDMNIFDAEIKALNLTSQAYSMTYDDYKTVLDYLTSRYGTKEAMRIASNTFTRKLDNRYMAALNKLVSQGTDIKTATKILDCIDTTGVCSYASVANLIVDSYKNNPSQFKKDFGFDLYTYENGHKEINSTELLVDMYVYINSNLCGGKLFTVDNGRVVLNSSVINTENQVFLSGGYGFRSDLVNKYLHSKNPDVSVNVKSVSKFKSDAISEVDNIKTAIVRAMQKGKQVTLGIYRTENNVFKFLDSDGFTKESTVDWREGAGHAVYVTGVTDKGVIISTWGKRRIISFDDFANNKYRINFIEMGIDGSVRANNYKPVSVYSNPDTAIHDGNVIEDGASNIIDINAEYDSILNSFIGVVGDAQGKQKLGLFANKGIFTTTGVSHSLVEQVKNIDKDYIKSYLQRKKTEVKSVGVSIDEKAVLAKFVNELGVEQASTLLKIYLGRENIEIIPKKYRKEIRSISSETIEQFLSSNSDSSDARLEFVDEGTNKIKYIDNFMKFSSELKASAKQISTHFGDAGIVVNHLLQNVMTASEILTILENGDLSAIFGVKMTNDEILTILRKGRSLTEEEMTSISVMDVSSIFGVGAEKVDILKILKNKNLLSDDEILRIINGQEYQNFKSFLENTRQGSWLSKLGYDQIKLLKFYSSVIARRVNETLRDTKGMYFKVRKTLFQDYYCEEIIDMIDGAIESFGGLDCDMVLYRAVGVESIFKHSPLLSDFYEFLKKNGRHEDFKAIYGALKSVVGYEIVDYGYMSTSPGYNYSFASHENKYPIVLQIMAPKGTKGAYINQISQYYNKEYEFLLAKATKMMIEDVSWGYDCNNREKIFVKVKIIL